jgi:hypothetical protein
MLSKDFLEKQPKVRIMDILYKECKGRFTHNSCKRNIICLTETGWGGMDWIGLAQDRDQWMALLNEPVDTVKC